MQWMGSSSCNQRMRAAVCFGVGVSSTPYLNNDGHLFCGEPVRREKEDLQYGEKGGRLLTLPLMFFCCFS